MLALLLASGLAAPADLPRLDLAGMLERLPAVSRDAHGFDDSPVNLLFIGSEPAMRAAAAVAGWADADLAPQNTPETEAFPPVSDEFLFGRRQDLAFLQDVRPLRSRHHFRLWRAPFAGPRGETLWIGTANFDADVAFSWRAGERCGSRGFYHRIAPDIDAERAFIRDSIAAAGAVVSSLLRSHPSGVRSGVDSKCSPYHTDGRVLVLTLRPYLVP